MQTLIYRQKPKFSTLSRVQQWGVSGGKKGLEAAVVKKSGSVGIQTLWKKIEVCVTWLWHRGRKELTKDGIEKRQKRGDKVVGLEQ